MNDDASPDHLKPIEEALQALTEDIKTSSVADDLDTLWTVVHRPGWTSVAEFALVRDNIELLAVLHRTIQHTATKLAESAQLVGADPDPTPW